LANGAYLAVERPPGRYTIRVEPVLPTGFYEADITVAPGGTYYFEIGPGRHAAGFGIIPDLIEPGLGGNKGTPVPGRSFNAAFRFNQLDAATGAAEVAKLKGSQAR